MLNNSSIDNEMPVARNQEKSFFERGIGLITLQYTIRDRATNTLSNRQAIIPTDLAVLPEFQGMYADVLRHAPASREKINSSGEADFFLINRDGHIIGCACLEMNDLSDRDLAWINCFFAENEGAVLALISDPMMHQHKKLEPGNFKSSKNKRRRA